MQLVGIVLVRVVSYGSGIVSVGARLVDMVVEREREREREREEEGWVVVVECACDAETVYIASQHS